MSEYVNGAVVVDRYDVKCQPNGHALDRGRDVVLLQFERR